MDATTYSRNTQAKTNHNGFFVSVTNGREYTQQKRKLSTPRNSLKSNAKKGSNSNNNHNRTNDMSMRIKVPANYYSKETTETIKEYTTHKLDGDDYGRGQLEAAEATTTNATDALGRLMETLAQKGLL